MLIIALSFVAAFLIVLSAGLFFFYREAMLDRLAEVTSRTTNTSGLLERLISRRTAHVQNLMDPFQRILPRSPKDISVVEKRLIRAGFRQESAINFFYGSKVLVPLVLTSIAVVTGIYSMGPFFVFGLTAGLGFMIPDFWLGNRMAARQLAIRLGLPDVLDLMVICIEAGLGLDQAVTRVCEEVKRSHPEITDELSLISMEQRAGRTRADAWRNLADRSGVDAVRALASTVIQADQFGTSVARTLRVHSDTLRTKRRQAAEEEAAKTTVKLVFPLVFFIFPSLFVVIVGPSAMIVSDIFDKYLVN
jgi:tight adherence protein C